MLNHVGDPAEEEQQIINSHPSPRRSTYQSKRIVHGAQAMALAYVRIVDLVPVSKRR